MTIRRKLQLVYALILLSTIGIGALALWSVASWQRASMDLTYSHVQGERVERVRGDIYRQVKEVVDWLTQEDKDADEEFRNLAAAINDELAMLGFKTGTEEECLAIENLGRSYRGLLSFAQAIFENPGTNRPKMPWLEEKIESQLFPELERRVETLWVYYRDEAALLDVRLPGMDGLQALRAFQERDADLPVIMLTACGTIETAVEAMKAGAVDYLCKPLDLQEVRLVVEKALDSAQNQRRLSYYQRREAARVERDAMVGACPAMRQVFRLVERFTRVVPGRAGELPTVLILGETGTGKGLVARAIHAKGPAAREPFVEVNCTTLPKDLIEAELFGYEKGAYTGATESKPGLVEAAEGGTLFLDEVGELPLAVQSKLLQLIEHKTVRRLGGLRTRTIPMPIIAATNRDLDALTHDGTFRQDLLYRLKVLFLELPPLRARGDDVRLLSAHFLQIFSQKYATKGNRLTPSAVATLSHYSWPGNVRELAHVIERAVLLSDQPMIGPDLIVLPSRTGGERQAGPGEDSVANLTLEEAEQRLMTQALTASRGNVSEAARKLGLSREALRYRLQKHSIVPARLK